MASTLLPNGFGSFFLLALDFAQDVGWWKREGIGGLDGRGCAAAVGRHDLACLTWHARWELISFCTRSASLEDWIGSLRRAMLAVNQERELSFYHAYGKIMRCEENFAESDSN
jgi:hypothetical protein